MCKLSKEEFLNTRFKENDIEYQMLDRLLHKESIKNSETAVYLFISTMRDIAEQKRNLYKSELDVILANQATDFDDDQLLMKLKELKSKNDNGEIRTDDYLFKVDEVLRNGNRKKRKYMQIDGNWTRIE